MSRILRVKNWAKFQHYKERNPPWVKLHYEMLTSRDWVALDDASRVLAIACILIASRDETHQGIISDDPDYIKRVAYLHKKPDFEPLISCGFLECASVALADASTLHTNATPETYRTETEKETEKKESVSGGRVATRPERNEAFEDFWKTYPSRGKGANPKTPARKLFEAAVKSGVGPGTIITALAKGAGYDRDKIGTEYIPQAVKWLRDRRWEDTSTADVVQLMPGQFHAMLDSPQYRAWQLEKRKTAPNWAATDSRGGWTFPSEWPPGYDEDGMPDFCKRTAP